MRRSLAGQSACSHIGTVPAGPTVDTMVVRQETHPGTGAGASPRSSGRPWTSMRAARLRPEVFCEEMPAPQRIAPFAAALSADVTVDDADVGTGRIILLHDPAGNDAWDGTFRCVAYARAEIDLELVTDPMLAAVGWTWLTEALDAHGATYAAASGTVTRVATESFGGMADEGGTAQIEIRASWTPLTPRRTPARRSTSPPTSRPGASSCAPPSACRRCPKESPPCRAARPARRGTLTRHDPAEDSTATPDDDRARATRTPPRRPSRPLLELCATACRRSSSTERGLREVCARLAAGTGPVAIDAERASGYRYSPRAYLIQLRREGAGTAPRRPDRASSRWRRCRRRSTAPSGSCTPPPRTSPASPRSACSPAQLFDTELAGRLLGYPRVGLATLVETLLGFRLAKEHSAVDWSTRPLPEPWLEYAALDVEVLVELRDALAAELEASRQGRVGAPGVRPPAQLRAHPPRRGVATYVGTAPGPRPAGARRRPRPVGDPRRDRRAARRHARAGSSPTPPSSPPPRPCRPTGRPCSTPRASTAAAPSATPPAGSPRSPRSASWPRTPCPTRAPRGDGPPLAARLGREGPRRRPPPDARPRGCSPRSPRSTTCRSRTSSPPTTLRRTLWTPPAHPRRGTPHRGRPHPPRRLRRPPLADRPDHPDPGRPRPSRPTRNRPHPTRTKSRTSSAARDRAGADPPLRLPSVVNRSV